jgi:hypothetical protein
MITTKNILKHTLYSCLTIAALNLYIELNLLNKMSTNENNFKATTIGKEYILKEAELRNLKTLPNIRELIIEQEYNKYSNEFERRLNNSGVVLDNNKLDSLEMLIYDSKQVKAKTVIRNEIDKTIKKIDELKSTKEYQTYYMRNEKLFEYNKMNMVLAVLSIPGSILSYAFYKSKNLESKP